MAILLQITTGDTNGNSIGNNGGYVGLGQSFLTTTGWVVDKLDVILKREGGTDNVPILIRIETDNAGVPSGTLAHANASATIPSFTSGTYAAQTVEFTDFSLSDSTKYWIVIKTGQTEASGQYYRVRGQTTNSYASGGYSTLTGASSWSAETTPDTDLTIYSPTTTSTTTSTSTTTTSTSTTTTSTSITTSTSSSSSTSTTTTSTSTTTTSTSTTTTSTSTSTTTTSTSSSSSTSSSTTTTAALVFSVETMENSFSVDHPGE